MKIFHTFISKLKSDRADSVVTALIAFPLTIAIIITGVDFGFFLNNKSAVTNAARDGARTIAILGGNAENEISSRYGIADPEIADCTLVKHNGIEDNTLTPTECQILTTLDYSSMVQVDIEEIECNPNKTVAVGETVNCTVKWRYIGLPMSTLNIISLAQENEGEGLGFWNTTSGWANAETSVQA